MITSRAWLEAHMLCSTALHSLWHLSMTQPFETGDPAALGFDPVRLSNIGPVMQQFVDDHYAPNLVTMVLRHGKLVFSHRCGYSDIESQSPVAEDTLFRLFSSTKPMAGLATLLLYEEGILTPDDPVTRFVPELKDMRVQRADGGTEPVRRDITIRDCLTNTTSLASLADMPMSYRQMYRRPLEQLGMIRSVGYKPLAINSRERMAALAQLPLTDHPGKHFIYHAGYSILGAVLEAASGRDMETFFRERIFKPLGMDDSGFYVSPDQADRLPNCYAMARHSDGHALRLQERAAVSEKVKGPQINFGIGGDAGGVVSTITDYARFAQMLLNGGELDGVRLLGRKTVDLMVGNHTGEMVTPMLGRGYHFGLGVAVFNGITGKPSIRSRGCYGWGGAAGTHHWADPQEGLLGLVFSQVHGTVIRGVWPDNEYQRDFQRLVYQSLV